MNRCIATLAIIFVTLSLLDGAQAGGRVWVHEKICSIEDYAQCVEWSTTEDVQIAPPGWTGADSEACVWRDDLNAGKCRPMEGWAQVYDTISKSDILIRNRVDQSPMEARNEKVRAAAHP
jgi:hypothetical protein